MPREYWLESALRIGEPVLKSLANKELSQRLPVAAGERACYAPLEAFGRLLAGLSPWLELRGVQGSETELQKHFRGLALAGLDAATDPSSTDRMNFSSGHQPIVDAAFLSHALVRAPEALRGALGERVRANLVKALKQTRTRAPHFNNWLLFAAMIETALYALGESDWDPMRVDYALRQHEQWYLGDGMYSDGPKFHCDYYNSFVIQPMLLDMVRTVPGYEHMVHAVEARAVRHAVVQERLISPEGTFPAVGRSLAYRFGAFHLLAQIALMNKLPPAVSPAQVRCALTAVMRRMMDAPGMFDEEGWLRVGFCGHQPEMGERYISTGSLYLCAAVFLPLGLPATDPFWADADAPWTACKAWGGQAFSIDKSLD